MFEERRNLIGRPPMYAKNSSRQVMPSKGWDRSQRLEPVPINVQQNRVRGVSLERKKQLVEGDGLRRSKSHYHVDDEGSAMHNANRVMPLINTHPPNSLKKPMFVDGNQNKVTTANSKQLNVPMRTSRFGHNQRSNPSNSLRPQVTSPYR